MKDINPRPLPHIHDSLVDRAESLDVPAEERATAWAQVLACPDCRILVQRQAQGLAEFRNLLRAKLLVTDFQATVAQACPGEVPATIEREFVIAMRTVADQLVAEIDDLQPAIDLAEDRQRTYGVDHKERQVAGTRLARYRLEDPDGLHLLTVRAEVDDEWPFHARLLLDPAGSGPLTVSLRWMAVDVGAGGRRPAGRAEQRHLDDQTIAIDLSELYEQAQPFGASADRLRIRVQLDS